MTRRTPFAVLFLCAICVVGSLTASIDEDYRNYVAKTLELTHEYAKRFAHQREAEAWERKTASLVSHYENSKKLLREIAVLVRAQEIPEDGRGYCPRDRDGGVDALASVEQWRRASRILDRYTNLKEEIGKYYRVQSTFVESCTAKDLEGYDVSALNLTYLFPDDDEEDSGIRAAGEKLARDAVTTARFREYAEKSCRELRGYFADVPDAMREGAEQLKKAVADPILESARVRGRHLQTCLAQSEQEQLRRTEEAARKRVDAEMAPADVERASRGLAIDINRRLILGQVQLRDTEALPCGKGGALLQQMRTDIALARTLGKCSVQTAKAAVAISDRERYCSDESELARLARARWESQMEARGFRVAGADGAAILALLTVCCDHASPTPGCRDCGGRTVDRGRGGKGGSRSSMSSKEKNSKGAVTGKGDSDASRLQQQIRGREAGVISMPLTTERSDQAQKNAGRAVKGRDRDPSDGWEAIRRMREELERRQAEINRAKPHGEPALPTKPVSVPDSPRVKDVETRLAKAWEKSATDGYEALGDLDRTLRERAGNFSETEQQRLEQKRAEYLNAYGLLSPKGLHQVESGHLSEQVGKQLKTKAQTAEGAAVRHQINRGLAAYDGAKSDDQRGVALGGVALANGADKAYADLQPAQGETLLQLSKESIDVALGLIPGVSSVNALTHIVHGMATGHDYLGNPMQMGDYALRGVETIAGILPVGGFKGAAKIGEHLIGPTFVRGAKLIRESGAGKRIADTLSSAKNLTHKIVERIGEVFRKDAADGVAKNRAAFERYVADLRREMERPSVTNPELKRTIDRQFREGGEIGNGSTAAAIRYERATGLLVKDRRHIQKGFEDLGKLREWLTKNPTARPGDRAAAENVIKDLEDALRGLTP